MPQRLKTGEKRVGVKQSCKAIREGKAALAYVAYDADSRVTAPVISLCRDTCTEIVTGATMREIGEAAGIKVPSSVAVLLK